MRLKGFTPAGAPPEVVYTVTVDDVEVGTGLERDEAWRLYRECTGYVTLTNQHGHCYAYKGRGFMGGDEPEDDKES